MEKVDVGRIERRLVSPPRFAQGIRIGLKDRIDEITIGRNWPAENRLRIPYQLSAPDERMLGYVAQQPPSINLVSEVTLNQKKCRLQGFGNLLHLKRHLSDWIPNP